MIRVSLAAFAAAVLILAALLTGLVPQPLDVPLAAIGGIASVVSLAAILRAGAR